MSRSDTRTGEGFLPLLDSGRERSEIKRLNKALWSIILQSTIIHEFDVVGITTSETLIVGECTFTQAPLGYNAFATLRDHVEELRWTPEDGGDRVETYALFSRCGFTTAVEEAADERDDLKLFSAGDVVEALT